MNPKLISIKFYRNSFHFLFLKKKNKRKHGHTYFTVKNIYTTSVLLLSFRDNTFKKSEKYP